MSASLAEHIDTSLLSRPFHLNKHTIVTAIPFDWIPSLTAIYLGPRILFANALNRCQCLERIKLTEGVIVAKGAGKALEWTLCM